MADARADQTRVLLERHTRAYADADGQQGTVFGGEGADLAGMGVGNSGSGGACYGLSALPNVERGSDTPVPGLAWGQQMGAVVQALAEERVGAAQREVRARV